MRLARLLLETATTAALIPRVVGMRVKARISSRLELQRQQTERREPSAVSLRKEREQWSSAFPLRRFALEIGDISLPCLDAGECSVDADCFLKRRKKADKKKAKWERRGLRPSKIEKKYNALVTKLVRKKCLVEILDDSYSAFLELMNQHGGPDAFPSSVKASIPALLLAQDALAGGDFDAARQQVDDIFEAQPLYNGVWWSGVDIFGLNIGTPVAYYGLRMLQKITAVGDVPTVGTLQMTAVVAPCATVTRPTLPNLLPETVTLDVDPQILDKNARLLHVVTHVFRQWVKAVTNGYEVKLEVYTMDVCASVNYEDDGEVIVSYPDSSSMIASVPDDVSSRTHFWWVVAPSGVPGDGTGYNRHFITGGMGERFGLPVFLSDDKWFTRKPEHLGVGPYSEVENRVYQPQWFQHEFMHHLYRTWPEFELETTPHQWFDRTTWPNDFEGFIEPDYYAESIDKCLSTAVPSLGEGLSMVSSTVSLGPDRSLDVLVGNYERLPIENPWHEVSVSLSATDDLVWENMAGVMWSLEKVGNRLLTEPGSTYPGEEVKLALEGQSIVGLRFNGETYRRVGSVPISFRAIVPLGCRRDLGIFVGTYEQVSSTGPSQQEVTVSLDAQNNLLWTNEAGVSWPLLRVNGKLVTAPNSPVGEVEVKLEMQDKTVIALWLLDERYGHVSLLPPSQRRQMDLKGLVGSYERLPIENAWHKVSIEFVSNDALQWVNEAGSSWSIVQRDGMLLTEPASPYGQEEIQLEVELDEVVALWFLDERYGRVSA